MVRAFLVLLVLIAGYLVFELGRISAGYDTVDAANQREALEDHIEYARRRDRGAEAGGRTARDASRHRA